MHEGWPSEDCTTPHIFRLPVEILQYIFRQAVLCSFDKDPTMHFETLDLSRCSLSSVCSWWRDIVISHHVLWASISYASFGGIPTPLNWIRLCLLRSGRHDLHLAIDTSSGDFNPLPSNFSLRKQNRNSTIGHLISFLDTMEDDMDRVFRLSVHAQYEHLQKIIIPLARIPKLKRLLLAVVVAPSRDIDVTMFGGLERLELCTNSMDRTTLVSLLTQCPSLRHLCLKTRFPPRHCRLGQSAHPALHAPRLHTLHLESVLPARAFDAPELKRLVSIPALGMGKDDFWWETNHFGVRTPDHHEEVALGHFPQLRQLTVSAWWNELDHLEPSIRLIQAHPDISEITLHGHRGAGKLLAGAFQRTFLRCPTIPPSADDGQEACAALENGMESEIQVPTALRFLTIQCNSCALDESMATVLRNMMLASDVLRIVILLRPHAGGVAMPNRPRNYTPLFTEFPGRCYWGILPSSATRFQDVDGVCLA